MADLADLARRGAILALVALHREGTMTAPRFAEAARMHSEHAKRLRDHLESAGFIEISVLKSLGAMREIRIALTPIGRKVAAFLAAADDAMHEGQIASGRPQGPT